MLRDAGVPPLAHGRGESLLSGFLGHVEIADETD
jgi:hypothetical protein